MFFRNDSNKLMCATVWSSTQRGDSLSEGASLLVAAFFLNSWHNKIIGNTSMYKILRISPHCIETQFKGDRSFFDIIHQNIDGA